MVSPTRPTEEQTRIEIENLLSRVVSPGLLSCMAARLGSSEPTCSDHQRGEIQRFAKDVIDHLHVLSKLRPYMDRIDFQFIFVFHGHADGTGFLSKKAERKIEAEFEHLKQLAPEFAPIPTNETANAKLACSRALRLLIPVREDLLAIRKQALNPESGIIVRCEEHIEKGDEFRGVQVEMRSKFITDSAKAPWFERQLDGVTRRIKGASL